MAPQPNTQPEVSNDALPPRPAPLGRTLIYVLAVFIGTTVATSYAKKTFTPVSLGYIEAHEVTLVAPFDARLVSQVVVEGQEVKPGDALYTLIDEKLERRQQAKQQQLAMLRAELQKAKAKAEVDLAWRIKSLENELLETKLKSANLLKEQFVHEMEEIARKEYDFTTVEVASLSNDVSGAINITPRNQEEERIHSLLKRAATQNAAEVINSQVELCDRRTNELERMKNELPDTIRKATGVDTLQVKLDQAMAEYAELTASQEQFTVSSPAYGLVGQFEFQTGQTIKKENLIVKILDNEHRHITLDVPSEKIHKYSIGDQLTLRFPNGKKSKGDISKIAPHVTPKEQLKNPQDDLTYVRLWITPAHQTWPDSPIGSQIRIAR